MVTNSVSDGENEYRLHLRNASSSNPELYREYTESLAAKARDGFQKLGRGVLLVVDDGGEGVHAYIPAEAADLQLGVEVSKLTEDYDPTREWILIGITDGRSFPIVMPF